MSLRLQPVQSRAHELTSYEHALADELEAIYGRGVHELAPLVDALNETGIRPPGGVDWTESSLTSELARLGAKE
ncbi:recombinase-like helix-turn-helix domain-containing protein [Streptosporangium carneum]|uniref:Recombinase-like domain-containing protein n=1 Tax=Streptosporangium carneum TaxID=47481 RepID=A0A9W6I3T2_9ACTN|nr:recombinase-like helix-turn-helix domain-containing protein [Streptosporangium carneum]GLK10673.1 hypothetical protein GCM10017600_40790 [Streptosporangium carneum]